MTPPFSPADLQRVLKTLPPERPDPFPHLVSLSPDALLHRRAEITRTLKTLEHERQVIDQELSEVYSDAELRSGIPAPDGWILQQRSRTSWDYAPEIREAIKGLQMQAQRDGRAQPLVSTYLCLTKEST